MHQQRRKCGDKLGRLNSGTQVRQGKRPRKCGCTPVLCTAKVVALRVAAPQRGACFEASYQRQNELTEEHTKPTVADDSNAKKNLETNAAFTANMMSTKNV
eukprot:4796515-Pleurochrysis_carterae.AAC.3